MPPHALDTAVHHPHPAPDALEPVSADLFRAVFRDHAARVVVVTAAGPDAPAGFTLTSLTSISIRPPMVSFAVARGGSSRPAVSRSRRVAIHLLADDQERLARTFATPGIDRFADVRWSPGPDGEPLLADCAAYLSCEVVQHIPAGDHVLVVARVVTARNDRPGAPLLYHDGSYASVDRPSSATPAALA
jgi:flavin reductase (DIM6/NTAB) family NADH-FMN oxidoreductase RutF